MISRVLVAAAALLFSACGNRGPGATPVAAQAPEPSVSVATATRRDLSGSITLTAEFVPFQEVEVMAKVAGYVKVINVDVGDRVKQGQLLATLEIPEMEDELARAASSIEQASAETAHAQDEVHRAESAHEMAHLSFTRIQNVSKREPGLVPQQEVDEVRSRDLVAEAQVAGAKSALLAVQEHVRGARAEQARVKTLQRYETITAPFDGIITKRYANTGAMIQAGTASQSQAMPVVKISQTRVLRLVLPVPESAVSQVRDGKAVDVRVTSLGRSFRGQVARSTGTLLPSTRTMDTEVDVPNPTLALMPGMYAEVDLHLQERNGVVAVPVDALEGSAANARVYTVSPSGAVHIVPVVVGLQTARYLEIQQGIEEGAAVVVGRRTGLKEGDRVKPVIAAFALEQGK